MAYFDIEAVKDCLREAYQTGYRDAQANMRQEMAELIKFAAELGIEVQEEIAL